ncbi:MAG TPA: hypothetical protein VM166_02235 [Gemmatimonadaceae bacterium]|nr:hypothetical protein [Gemmatimonadaceae bacterium]
MPAVVSLPIDSIAAGGDGVGRKDGLVVFVPRTAPGDVVTAQVSGKGHFARGLLKNIVTPSTVRIDPPCPHYTRDRCGGCQVQHMTYDSQLVSKQLIIRDSIQRIGKRDVDPPPVARSPKEWRYRTKLTLTMQRRGVRWIAGLHPYDDPARVFALADCPITDRAVVSAWKEIMTADAFFPDADSLRGSVRITSGGATFVMIGGESWAAREQFRAAVPSLAALWWEPGEFEGRKRRLLFDARSDKSPSASFEQVNAEMAEVLRGRVLEHVRRAAPRTVVDAYAGAGHTAIALASDGIVVTAIELDQEAASWSAARLSPPSRSVAARVEDVLPDVLPADVVIINPPRAGVDARVSEILNARATDVSSLIYVSCNPATLARDLARMPRFRISALEAFDMFPQTAHVETLCELTPAPESA